MCEDAVVVDVAFATTAAVAVAAATTPAVAVAAATTPADDNDDMIIIAVTFLGVE